MAKKYNAVAGAGQDASQTFVKGAAILTVSMIVVKVFGVLDKVILTNIYSMFGKSLASMGMGIYNNAYEVFGVIFIVARSATRTSGRYTGFLSRCFWWWDWSARSD